MSPPSTATECPVEAAPRHPEFLGHPRPLYTLFATEMWERFSYYGMRALLFVFMITPVADGGLGYTTERAGIIYGTYTMCVYMFGIPSGFLADNFLGAHRSVLLGGIVLTLGHFSLAAHSELMFFLGLGLIVIGTGLLKPNVSTMVGGLYAPNDLRRDAGFSIFYMGINVGATLSPFVTGYLAQSIPFKDTLRGWGFDPAQSWHWGFVSAGVGMTLGLLNYVAFRRPLARLAPPPSTAARPWKQLGLVLAATAAVLAIVTLSDLAPAFQWIRYGYVGVPLAAIIWFGTKKDPESRRLASIGVFALASIIFWAIYEQAGSSGALFAEELTDRTLPHNGIYHFLGLTLNLGSPFPSAWFQAVQGIGVIVLAPAFAWLWVRLGERQPSSPAKFTFGLFFLALSFLLMVPAAQLTVSGKVSPLWLTAVFLLQVVGELCLSPVGLSTMTKLAPPRLVGLIMGIWFLSMALGNKLAGVLASDFDTAHPAALAHFFLVQSLWVAAATLALFVCIPWVKRLMGGVR
ncbi:MAG TPA: peptide MFS transporter [Opitutus sp.]|nr:peptide MFS transporter [Opitutus sp.]